MAAGINLALDENIAKLVPRLTAPNKIRNPKSIGETTKCYAMKLANILAMVVAKQMAGNIKTSAYRLVSTVAMANLNAIKTTKPSPTGETLPVRDSETIMPAPAITAALAILLVVETVSRKNI